jgi:hypothetical protein
MKRTAFDFLELVVFTFVQLERPFFNIPADNSDHVRQENPLILAAQGQGDHRPLCAPQCQCQLHDVDVTRTIIPHSPRLLTMWSKRHLNKYVQGDYSGR